MHPFSDILDPFWRHLASLWHRAVLCVLLTPLAGGAVFPLQDAYGQTRPVLADSLSSQRPLVVELPKPLPEFDPDNPQAIGIILVFHRWPDEEERKIILEKTADAGLTKTDEIPRFKIWLFQWGEWRKAAEAEKVCRSLPDLFSLEYCEPDSLLGPATGERLREPAMSELRKAHDPGARLVVSPMSAWEIAMLVAKGKMALASSPDVWFDRFCTANLNPSVPAPLRVE